MVLDERRVFLEEYVLDGVGMSSLGVWAWLGAVMREIWGVWFLMDYLFGGYQWIEVACSSIEGMPTGIVRVCLARVDVHRLSVEFQWRLILMDLELLLFEVVARTLRELLVRLEKLAVTIHFCQ